jgi:putative transposase
MADSGIVCSMSRSGNAWDNAAMESFFSPLKTALLPKRWTATHENPPWPAS